ncbi:MAG: aldehyde dehydrogenase [Parcubacteria group bacterium Gr01-1014_18]|nr:MAG: aldehyde dehydrogenase [Parcubacteria group bacterium Greene0416_36]TSC80224.1 MAG: aldehyde dehydrogenase [Parcubacteria group bacterium Gr01-1014_18]TSC98406.1 MAG: aldehyde dehydrogenase [Parcubacteria group bacterium Greene1014_20]TSD06947.1 MAG: aldehyde dehydrogenase [Parcubacteria group bacterium Greene0714_2]
MPFISKNPATEEVLAAFPELTESELEKKLALAFSTYKIWRTVSFGERASLLRKAAVILREESKFIGQTITLEMGKPIAAAIGEVEKCALVCDYYAENAEKILASEHIPTENAESFVRFDPLGIVLSVMPWNFPLWQVFRFAAPATMAGNVGILKHASNVPQCGMIIEEVFRKAGFPDGVFTNLMVGSAQVEKIIRDPRVVAVTLTGSEWAGSQVAMQCGKEIKKTVLELGGSDPFIVLEDADLDLAVKIGITARLQNCGQSCIAAKRFIIVGKNYDAFLGAFKKGFESLVVGDPIDPRTQMGPLATEAILNDIDNQIRVSLEKGAQLITGGKRLDRKGYFLAPTILAGITSDMPAYYEEFFGPVALVFKAKDAADAVRIANDTSFGLGASIWSRDIEKAKLLARDIEAGSVFINKMVLSDPRLPFGGIKKSGYGRELSHYGIKEFCNIKTVVVA